MAGIHCERCGTKTLPEQDGRSCSNCGSNLLTGKPGPKPTNAPPGPPPGHVKKPRHNYPIIDASATPHADGYRRPQRNLDAELAEQQAAAPS